MMSIAVYNSSDVDISNYVVGISGLDRRHDFDFTIELPSPTIEVHSLDYEKNDEIYILLDGVKIFHLYINDIQYDYSSQVYTWKCQDILYKLHDFYPEDFTDDWFDEWSPTSDEWDYNMNPSGYPVYGYAIQVLYFIKVLIHLAEPVLSPSSDYDFSEIETINSPYLQYEPQVRTKKYNKLYFFPDQIQNFGNNVKFTEDSDINRTINCFDVLNEILKYLKVKLRYYNDKYYLTQSTYSIPAVNNIYKKIDRTVDGYQTVVVSYGYTDWGSYNPNGFISGEITEDDGNGGDSKHISIIGNFEFMARYQQSNEIYPLWGDGYINNMDYLFAKQAGVLLLSYYITQHLCDIEVPLIYDVTPFSNELVIGIDKLESKIKCKNPDYGFPYTLPLILR